jgi:hypothetical protein
MAIFLYFGPFKKSRNESGWNLFPRSGPFESRQFSWRNSLRSHASAHGATHGACVWPDADVVPQLSESRQSFWHDSITPTAMAQLTCLFYRTSIKSRHVRRRDSRRSHANHHGVTHQQNMAPLPFSFFLLSFSLPSFSSTHLVAAPLAISSSPPKSEPLMREIDSISWYPNRVGYICCLYRLNFVLFWNFCLDELLW